MKVVLRKDVEGLGERDEVVGVSDGHARNFLFPRGLAAPASKAELAVVEKRKAKREKELEARRAEFEALAKKLSDLEVSIPSDAGEEGKLFGSVTSQDIALAVKEASDLELDKKKIDLSEPLKVLGEYSVPVRIYKDISAKLKVKVVAK
jgi:large subunit ribosomal protein L9